VGSQGRRSSCWHCCAVRTPVPSFWFSQACCRIAHDSVHTHYCLCLRLPPARTKLSSLLSSFTVSGTTILLTIIEHAAPFAGITTFSGVRKTLGVNLLYAGTTLGWAKGATRKGPVAIATGDRNLTFYPGQFLHVRVRLGHILQVCIIFCRGTSYRLKFRSE
jgi:hypothetical protein